MKGLKIVFMGTPEFAVHTLEKILNSRRQIVGVVSQPDRPRGRGKKLLPTPVKQFAIDNHLSPIFQPESLKDPGFIGNLNSLNADVFVVVAYRILPEVVFTMPSKGTINLHPSLLPQYRGAAPLNWAIIRGETRTGLSTIFIRKEIDAGNIVFQREIPIYPDETAGALHDRLAPLGGDLIVESLKAIEEGRIQTRPQDDSLATPAPKITKEMCHLNFEQPAEQVKNWIHGLSPFPGAFAHYNEQIVKLYLASVVSQEIIGAAPGTILKAEKEELHIACQPGIIAIKELQIQGRKRLKTGDFLRGMVLEENTVLR